MNTQHDFKVLNSTITRLYTGSDVLKIGYAMCYDLAQSAANDRERIITQPSWANLVAQDGFAGVISKIGTTTSAGTPVELIPWDGRRYPNLSVWTDENVAAGDLLAPIPGTYVFGRAVIGQPRFQAWAASDRSTTAGLANGCFGPIDMATREAKALRLFDHFTGERKVAATVAAAVLTDGWVLRGTTAVAAFATAATTPAGTGTGELTLTPTTTTIAQILSPGVPFLLSAGRSAFCRARVQVHVVANAVGWVGLAGPGGADVIAANAGLTDGTFTDGIGFLVDPSLNTGNWTAVARKASGTAIGVSLAVPPVADVYVDLAFLARNKKTGTAVGNKSLVAWVNGVLVDFGTSATQLAQFPDTVPICGSVASIQAAVAAPTITIDRFEAVMNLP